MIFFLYIFHLIIFLSNIIFHSDISFMDTWIEKMLRLYVSIAKENEKEKVIQLKTKIF